MMEKKLTEKMLLYGIIIAKHVQFILFFPNELSGYEIQITELYKIDHNLIAKRDVSLWNTESSHVWKTPQM